MIQTLVLKITLNVLKDVKYVQEAQVWIKIRKQFCCINVHLRNTNSSWSFPNSGSGVQFMSEW